MNASTASARRSAAARHSTSSAQRSSRAGSSASSRSSATTAAAGRPSATSADTRTSLERAEQLGGDPPRRPAAVVRLAPAQGEALLGAGQRLLGVSARQRVLGGLQVRLRGAAVDVDPGTEGVPVADALHGVVAQLGAQPGQVVAQARPGRGRRAVGPDGADQVGA